MKNLGYWTLAAGLIMALACGDNVDFEGAGGIDAGPGVDAEPTPEPMPTSGTCGIVINLEQFFGTATTGFPVYFNGPDGSLLGTDFTDVKGEASFDSCVADTNITFVLENMGPEGQIYTYTNVNPGDTVYFGGGQRPMKPLPLFAQMNVSVSQDVAAFLEVNETTAMTSYDCDGDSDEGLADVLSFDVNNCSLGQTDTDVDVLSYIHGPNGGLDNVIGYAFAKDVPLNKGALMNTAFTDITMPAWTPGDLDNALLVTNLPTGVGYVEGRLEHMVDGVRFRDDYFGMGGGNPLVLSRVFRGLPDGFGESTRVEVMFYGPDSVDGSWRSRHVGQLGAFDRTTTVDLSDAQPNLAGVVVSDLDSMRPTLSWISDGPVAGNLGITQVLLVLDNWDTCDQPDDDSVSWFLVSPDVSTGIYTVPELPANALDFVTDDIVGVYPWRAALMDVSWMSYQDIATTPGFAPQEILDEESEHLRYFGEAEEQRFRRTYWHAPEYPNCDD